MEAHIVGEDIDTVSSQHIEGGMGDVNDAGYSKDKRKSNSEKGEYTPANETAYNNVDNETHTTPSHQNIKP
jgi:hypothetical protein